MPLNTYCRDLMGKAEIAPAGRFEAGSWGSFTLVYTAGKFGIDDQGGIKIGLRGHFDGSQPQLDDPLAPGFTTVETSSGVPVEAAFETRRNIRPWNKSLFIRCLRFLKEGDTITVRFGDQRQGSPGFQQQTFCESDFTFQVLVDAFATHDFTALPDGGHPFISVVPGAPETWKAIVPTLCRPGEAFSLSIKAEDCYGNPSDRIDRKLALRCSSPVAGLPSEIAIRPGTFARRVEGITVDAPGRYVFEILDADGVCLCRSNPLLVRDGDYRHFWSDMHGQSKETIGVGSAREYFDFARNKGLVDICGHQGNDFQITDAFWNELNELTVEFDEPGRFLAIPGYEWSGNTGLGGDHNVWYRREGRPIYRSSRALVEDRTNMETDAHSSQDLIDRLQDEDALVVAHVGGRYADVSYAHDGRLEPSVEIHSAWGTFEWILKDALEANYRVGVVASSDGHKGRPGASYPGDSAFGSYGGLTCHLMDNLHRDDLFAAFRKRRHYATTGARMFVDVSAMAEERILIGDIVETGRDRIDLTIDVEGTAPVERVDIFDGMQLLQTFRPWHIDDGDARLRITCAGQNYRGRGRLVRWKGSATLSHGSIRDIGAVNFWNPLKQPSLTHNGMLKWEVVTTGGASSVDIEVSEDAWAGEIAVTTSEVDATVRLADVGIDGLQFDCGGMDKRLILSRLPAMMTASSFRETVSIDIGAGTERRLFVRVTQEDGHIAWTSPIYVSRRAG